MTPRIKPIQPQGHRDTVESSFLKNGVSVSLWLLLFCSAVQAKADGVKKPLTVDEISQKVDAAQSGVKDAQMDLGMEMKDSLSGSVQKIKGQVKIKNPDKVFVHYSEPISQDLYVSGPLAQMYQPAQKMVYRQKSPSGKEAETPLYVGVGKELKRYMKISQVSILQDSDQEIRLLFKPKNADDAGFDEMRVTIRKSDWWPTRMEVTTPSATTRAEFDHFHFNQGLKDDLFSFTPPKDTEVVDGAVF